ncbi:MULTISPECIES: lysophospholipid acyltransferase family protein [Rhodomicrobium]|uniref:lysophospholipid acyltransferase family protein n=1 Tax=Rhodomicrobium TaxID=1068 RepID=UPI000B4AF109|nr:MULTISPECIES: lysophospholipid acyltransferase family protein [Rhodomicrobium]
MLRSLIFAVVFYVNIAVFLIFSLPLLLGPRRWAMAALEAHARVSIWWMRVIVGTGLEVRGRENLPAGPALIASKHQSAWDTFGLIPLTRDPAMVMKKELLSLPIYGWFCRKFEMIPIARELGPAALRQMVREAAKRAGEGRDVVIFPEGTRRAPGAPGAYMPGVVMLYEQLKLPCVPVALNSGVFWPRRSIWRRPGTIVVEFLPAIPPGVPRRDFRALLEDRIETATARLVAPYAAELAARKSAAEASDEGRL